MNQELRIIVTQACNYNCYFCHREGLTKMKKNMLTAEDIGYLYKVANKYLGMKKVSITGGEPLILDNILDIVKELNSLGCYTTIISNGSFLDEKIEVCRYIQKLNISMHSLDKTEYETIVGKKDTFAKVVQNIKLAKKQYPNLEINLNFAFINGNNIYKKVQKLIEFTKENEVNIKFIELFPKNCKDYLPIENLQEFLLSKGHVILQTNDRKTEFSNSGKSRIYTMKCYCSRAIDFESASEFCNKNNDVFITPDGNAKVCRMKQDEIQLLDDIKNKNERELSNKLSLSFKKLGEGCPFEKNVI